MALSLESYAILPSKVPRLCAAGSSASHMMQHFDANEVGALSSLAARHGCSVLHPSAADVRVRVCSEGGMLCDVIIIAQAGHGYKASVQEAPDSIEDDSCSAAAAGASAVSAPPPRLHSAVRAVVIISRCSAHEAVQLLSSCSRCASVVVVASVEWLFHCCVTSTLRSPFLYALPPALLPLSSVHATSSGIIVRSALISALLDTSPRHHRRPARAPHACPPRPRRHILPQPRRAMHAPHRPQHRWQRLRKQL